MKHFFNEIVGFSQFEEQGKLLNTILEFLPKKDKLVICEIGVFMGRGTAMWNVDLINKNIDYEYYAIDHFEGSAEHDKSINYYEKTVENLEPISDKINIIKNNSISESENYPNKFFDIIYLDASHDYESVKNDIKAWLPKLKLDGIICGDDYIKGWDGVIQAVDEAFGSTNIHKVGGQQWYVLY